MATTFTLGQAAYVNTGAYSSSKAYAPLNTCYYNGGTWVALASVTNVTPGSDNTKWLCITNGIKTITLAPGATGYVTVTITLTDGTTASTSYPITDVGDGTITVAKLASGFVLPVNKGGTGASSASAALASLGAQKAFNIASVTLTAAGWDADAKTQAVTISGLAANSEFIAKPDTKAAWIAAQGANIYPPTASANTLTFECAAIPSSDISVKVYWW